jgi:tetratricopeptide (TPR) repeat protein
VVCENGIARGRPFEEKFAIADIRCENIFHASLNSFRFATPFVVDMSIRCLYCQFLFALILLFLAGCQSAPPDEQVFFANIETLPGVHLSLSPNPPRGFRAVGWERVLRVHENGGSIWLFLPGVCYAQDESNEKELSWLKENQAVCFSVGEDSVYWIPSGVRDNSSVIAEKDVSSWLSQEGFAQLQKRHGDDLLSQGKIEEAIAAYSQAVSHDPSDFDAQLALGDALSNSGKKEAALSAYLAALTIEPDNYSALRRLGELYLDLHRPVLAIEPLTKAYLLQPGDAEVLLFVALALGQSGHQEQALRVLELAEAQISDESKLKTINDIRNAFSG